MEENNSNDLKRTKRKKLSESNKAMSVFLKCIIALIMALIVAFIYVWLTY